MPKDGAASVEKPVESLVFNEVNLMLSLVGAELFIFKDGEEKELKPLSLDAKSRMFFIVVLFSVAVLDEVRPSNTS